jgi:hypothetical protein
MFELSNRRWIKSVEKLSVKVTANDAAFPTHPIRVLLVDEIRHTE